MLFMVKVPYPFPKCSSPHVLDQPRNEVITRSLAHQIYKGHKQRQIWISKRTEDQVKKNPGWMKKFTTQVPRT